MNETETTTNFGCGEVKVHIHPSPENPKHKIVSIRGIDVHEACDGYTHDELRAISRYLENLADKIQYQNENAITETLFRLD